MAFNGSGTYNLPGAALVDGQTVSATEHNTFRNDVATALTACVTRDGQSPATANLPMGGFKITGLAAGASAGDSVRYEQVIGVYALIAGSSLQDFAAQILTLSKGLNEARGSIAMHATTMDIWAQPNLMDGTGGAVTITAIANAPQAGARRTLYPPAGTVITNNAMFAVQGSANYTTVAGDGLTFEAITTSTYKVWLSKIRTTGTYAETIVPHTSPVTITTTGTDQNIASLVLTELGTYLVGGSIGVTCGTVNASVAAGVSAVSNTLPNPYDQLYTESTADLVSGRIFRKTVPVQKIVVTVNPTTVYLVGSSSFSGTQPTMYGKIYANKIATS